MLVKPEQLKVRRTDGVEVIVEGVDLLEKVRQSRAKDNEVIKVVKEMKWARVKMLRDEEQRKIDSIIYKERKMYISKDKKLRTEIIRLHHNTLVEGHRRQQKIVELITRNFQQLGVTKKVKQYMKRYNFYLLQIATYWFVIA